MHQRLPSRHNPAAIPVVLSRVRNNTLNFTSQKTRTHPDAHHKHKHGMKGHSRTANQPHRLWAFCCSLVHRQSKQGVDKKGETSTG